MNKFRILALVLVLSLVVPVLCACGSEVATSTVSIVFRVPVEEAASDAEEDTSAADDTTVADGTTAVADTTAADTTTAAGKETQYKEIIKIDNWTVEGNPPSILQAVQTAFAEYEVDYELTKDGHSIASVTVGGVKYAESEEAAKDEDGNFLNYFNFWECSVNDLNTEGGRQSTIGVYEGDKIVFTWTRDFEYRQDTTAAESYDENADTTGEIFTRDTTVAVDTEEVA